MNEVEIFIPVLFDKSFNFDLDENINFDFENIHWQVISYEEFCNLNSGLVASKNEYAH